MQERASKLRRGSTGVEYGKPAYQLDAAQYTKTLWENHSPVTIKNCFKKAGIMKFDDDVHEDDDHVHVDELLRSAEGKLMPELLTETVDQFDMNELVCAIPGVGQQITAEEIQNYLHIDDEDSPDLLDAILTDVKEVLNERVENPESTAMDCDDDEESVTVVLDDSIITECDEVLESLTRIGGKVISDQWKLLSGSGHDRLMTAFQSFVRQVRSLSITAKKERVRNTRQTTLHECFRK